MSMPQNIYDNADFFQGYSQFRRSKEGLAGAPEWVALRKMLPPIRGLRVLDLGCGFGFFSRWARENGARQVVGIDLSEKMLERARALDHHRGVAYYRAKMENLGLAESTFDLVYSSLALHYIQDFGAVCAALRNVLKPQGHLVFSVEHPIYTAPTNPAFQTNADGSKVWLLDGYLMEGRRVTDWIAPGIVKYHRTLASYVNALVEQKFRIEHIDEWGPDAEQIAENPEWADERQRPPFLLMSAQLASSET